MGGGLTLELPGPQAAAREKRGLEGDTGSSRGRAARHSCLQRVAGLSCGACRGQSGLNPWVSSERPPEQPRLLRGLRRRQGASPWVWR